MKIMSFNVLCYGPDDHDFEDRKPLVVESIRKEMPDILGTQESHIFWMNYLSENLPEYAYVGVGRNDGKQDGEFSPVFYRKDLYDVLDNGTFWLSETPDVPSKGWDARCIRICSYALLSEKATGKKFAAVNTHLDHIGEEARVKGIQLVVDKLRSFGDIPVFCTGDFNTDEGSPAYKIMTADFMADAKYVAEQTETGNTFSGFKQEETKDNSPIDFVFVKKGAVRVLSYHVNRELVQGQYASDHFPVVSEIEF